MTNPSAARASNSSWIVMKLLFSMPLYFPRFHRSMGSRWRRLELLERRRQSRSPPIPIRESEAICLGPHMSLIYTLFYRRGSFAQSEIFGSLKGAVSRAYGVFNLEGYSTFSIEDGGGIVMHNSQIEEHCRAARFALLSGTMPERSL
jgi:hypothetical protein